LQEKQRKENGLASVAPNLIMPIEKDRKDQEMDLLYNNMDSGGNRMGGRIGGRMESRSGQE